MFGLWFVCVAVAIAATVFIMCVAVPLPAIVFLLCLMVFKRRDGVRGSREKRGRKEFWQVRSRLMGGRNGFANSVRSQMCGRGGVADDATPTSRQGCGVSTGRRWQQGPENGQRAPRRRAERKMGRLKVRRQREEGCGRRPGRARPSTKERKWHGGRVENKGESCRRICEMLKSSRVWRKRPRTASRMTCSSNCKRWSKGGTTKHPGQKKKCAERQYRS